MQKWQYLLATFVTDEESRLVLRFVSDENLDEYVGSTYMADVLNTIGDKGWELASHSSSVVPTTNSYKANTILIFKRPIVDPFDILSGRD